MAIPKITRRIIVRMARGRILQRSLRIEGRRAGIYVSGDAQLKYLKPGRQPFDQDLLDIAMRCIEPEDCVWDVGANIGVFSVAAATRGASVIAIEADIWLADLIRRTARLAVNSDLRISVIPCALSDREGIPRFQIAQRGRAERRWRQITNGRCSRRSPRTDLDA